jgi:hypothetical protein
MHESESEPRRHFTARGFVGGYGCFTIHADLRGQCFGAFRNAAYMTGVYLDIDNECEECI